MVIEKIRKNIGTIVAALGFMLLVIMTFGDLGEFTTAAYWQNVYKNLTSIGIMTIGLTMVQVCIKQGISEQALQTGLKHDNATSKYAEHKQIIDRCAARERYLPYFLTDYNNRMTLSRKQEFLTNNNFTHEEELLQSGKKRIIRKYRKMRTSITSRSIRWATTTIEYDKRGRIKTLAEHRSKRLVKGMILSMVFMAGALLLGKGLFFEPSDTPITQKFIQLLYYILVMGITSIFPIIGEYEKGKFGVPNELTEINRIWLEFKNWEIPSSIIKELEKHEEIVIDEKEKTIDIGAVIQSESPQIQNVQ